VAGVAFRVRPCLEGAPKAWSVLLPVRPEEPPQAQCRLHSALLVSLGGDRGLDLTGHRGSMVPTFSPQGGLHPVHADSNLLKPRVVTVVKLGGHPLRKITLLLNRRSVQTFEQLLADVSEALGFPRWKSDRVRKLFSLKGREIRSVSDFFREGDAFIAVGKEPLTLKNIQVAIEELYPSKARALTLTQHSRLPSPRLRSRLYSKALKGGHHCGETETTKSSGEAARSQAAIRHQGRTPVEDTVRAQKKWVRGKWEPEPSSKVPRDATLERHASGEKHLGVEIEKTSGEIIRCEKCKRERELQQSLQRERLSLGTSELDLGRCPGYDVERLVRTRSCRRSPEEKPQGGEEGCKEGTGSSPGHPPQEPRRPSKSTDKKEDRDPGGQEGHCPAAAKAKRDVVGEAQPIREEKDSRTVGRSKQGGWLRRQHPADLDPEKLPRTRGDEQEAEKGKKPGASGGRRMVSRDEPPARVEKEPKTRPEESKAERPGGRRRRPPGILAADVRKQYEPGRVIGDGNFAVVKECRHRGTQQAYAMKIIDKSKLKGKEDMVDSEILIIQSLSHPNIVKLHQVYETDTEIYLIMEYVQGGDLFDAIIESVKFPERDAALMLMDLCKALVHMHDKSIVHRDLKPENLLVRLIMEILIRLPSSDLGSVVKTHSAYRDVNSLAGAKAGLEHLPLAEDIREWLPAPHFRVQRNEDKSTTLKLADFGLAKH
ncbi:hypothetical protein E2I00_012622, partial [Balaenoptera physalus]